MVDTWVAESESESDGERPGTPPPSAVQTWRAAEAEEEAAEEEVVWRPTVEAAGAEVWRADDNDGAGAGLTEGLPAGEGFEGQDSWRAAEEEAFGMSSADVWRAEDEPELPARPISHRALPDGGGGGRPLGAGAGWGGLPEGGGDGGGFGIGDDEFSMMLDEVSGHSPCSKHGIPSNFWA